MKFAGFQWDAGNWPKCGRHGLTKTEIETVFERGVAVAPDIRHSEVEERYVAIGRTADDRPVFVGFCSENTGRPGTHPPDYRKIHACEGGQAL